MLQKDLLFSNYFQSQILQLIWTIDDDSISKKSSNTYSSCCIIEGSLLLFSSQISTLYRASDRRSTIDCLYEGFRINIHNQALRIGAMDGGEEWEGKRWFAIGARANATTTWSHYFRGKKMWEKFGRAGAARPASRMFGEILKFVLNSVARRFTLAPVPSGLQFSFLFVPARRVA